MLKIKDNVDLKELEKFGFEFDKRTEDWIVQFADICVLSWCRKICHLNNEIDVDILFDLIKAGLVEKVEEQKDE